MKVVIEKLPLSGDTSFVARTYRTPNFEMPWHQHIELEMILFQEGAGLSFIGNHVGEFAVDDIYFLGRNLPHTFQNQTQPTSAVVVQFREDFWGADFLRLPESKPLLQLFQVSLQGLKVQGESRALLRPLIQRLEQETGFERIILLCQCLRLLAERREWTCLSTQEAGDRSPRQRERIDQVFQFTMENFRKSITLSEVSALAGLSVPAFCNYFKKSTKKKYVDFLNEIRIGYASKMLIDTKESVNSICYDSGFNTLAHFNKQFLKNRKMTPSQFRKVFLNTELAEQAVSLEQREIEGVMPVTYREL